VVLAVYVEWNKDSLLAKARATVNARINGTLDIGQIDISLFSHFPAVTIRLTNISLRDSAWPRHRHDLVKAARLDIGCAPLRSLFKGRLELNKLSLEHGTIYFFTDSTGYSNTYLFKPRPGAREEKSAGGSPREIELTDIHWVIEQQDRHKLFDLDVRRLKTGISRQDRDLRFDATMTLEADSLSFNTEKGSFIRRRAVIGKVGATYNLASHILQVQKARLTIDGYPVMASGRFFPTVKPDPFFLSIDVERIPFRQAAGWLTPHLREKLAAFDIDKPVSIHAQLDAGSADQRQPQIQVRLNLGQGSVVTPAGHFDAASFQGSFTNEWIRGKGREDENSAILLTAFSGRLDNLPLRADSLLITNLKDPQLACDLHSRFALADLNDVFGSETLQFQKGDCRMDLRYKGPLSENDSTGATVNGELEMDSAGLLYTPYQFALSHINGRLLFRDQDLVVDHLEARAGNTKLRIKGVAKNLISLLDHNAEDVSMDWALTTSHLALEDFTALAGRSGTGATKRSTAAVFGATARRIDNFLKAGLIHVSLDAADLSYEDFTGAHARADLVFQGHDIRLTRMTIAQGTGKLDLKAVLERQPGRGLNPLTLESHLDQADLPGLFASFDNFGQKAITAHNLKGKVDADITMTGLLTDQAKIVPNSLKGTVDFLISEGQLIDFEPIEKVHEKILKNRDLSEIRFGTLQNRLDIDSTTVTLHRMEIRSTAFTLYAEGRYDLRKGTDMSLQVPISNLKAKPTDVPPESRGNDSKAGLSVRLRARTDEDGQLKITWDPFRRGLKKLKKP
jgi:hypothetical protein